MSENVKIKILDIDAQKSTQSIADLKREIRDLKGQLAGLEEGTDKYNSVLAECADKTHQLKEIQEQVSRSSADFGDRMSNVRGTIAGMSGAIGAVTGALALMGVEADKDSKLMKVMVSAMSITSGIQAIDAGVKSFKALTVSIKAASTAAKGFQASLGWIALALTAVATAAYLVRDAVRDTNKETENAINLEMTRISMSNKAIDKALDFEMELARARGKSEVEVLEQHISSINKEIETLDKENASLKRGMEEAQRMIANGWKAEDLFGGQYEQRLAEYNAYLDRRLDLTEERGETERNLIIARESEKTRAEKEAETQREQEAKKAYETNLKLIKDRYNLANAVAKLAYEKHEIDDAEYYQKLYDNLVEYNNKIKKAQKQTAGELAAMQLAEYEAAMKVSEARINAREKELEHLQKMNEKPMVQRSTAGDSNAEASENREMTQGVDDYRTRMEEAGILERMRLNEEYQEWLTKLEDEHILARLQREAQALREELEILTLNKDNQLANIQQRYDGEKEILDARLSENLISQEEYDRQLEELNKGRLDEETALNLQFVDESAAIQAQITATERDAAMQRIEISEKERQKKIENVKKYMSAATSALSMSSQLISALQENLDTTTEEGFEQNKKYEMANATISFLQGLISAWSSAMELGPIAGPIAGGVLTALLTAIYGANMAKIQSTTLNSGSQGGGASMNKVTLQSIEHPISNVRQTTTASDYDELSQHSGDTRVVVLASDIEEVVGQRRVQVSNATY